MTTSAGTAASQEAAEKVNILVVDDLPEKHVVFRTVLDELDQNIVSARSGQEALKYILEMEFAVILLDVNMPDIDGLETASLIRQYKKSAQTSSYWSSPDDTVSLALSMTPERRSVQSFDLALA